MPKTSFYFLKFVFLAGLIFSWLFLGWPFIISFAQDAQELLGAVGADGEILQADIDTDIDITAQEVEKKEFEPEEDKEEDKSEDKNFTGKNFGDIWIAVIKQNSKSELWISDFEKKNWQKIVDIDAEMISENSPIGFQEEVILWLSGDSHALVGFDTLNQVIFSQTIEPLGNTIIEFNYRKYILLVQNDNISLMPQLSEATMIDEINF